MAELELARELRLVLRARAHHLDPIVRLGAQGLTEAVLKEIERALLAHELIKVRVPLVSRDQCEELFAQIAQRLDAARIVHIGKLLVLYRPRPAEADAERTAPRAQPTARGRDRNDRPQQAETARRPRIARGRGR
jgi:RNA-binding protein